MILYTDKDKLGDRPLYVRESEMAFSQGPISTSRLRYCGALMLSKDGKNFAAHIFPPDNNHCAPEIAEAIEVCFKPPYHLRYVLGSQDFYKDDSYMVIEQVVRLLIAKGHAVTLDKVGEVDIGRVHIDAKGNITADNLFPCALNDEKTDFVHGGMTYVFNRRVAFRNVEYNDVRQLMVKDKEGGTVLYDEAVAVLDPQTGLHRRASKDGATCAIYLAKRG